MNTCCFLFVTQFEKDVARLDSGRRDQIIIRYPEDLLSGLFAYENTSAAAPDSAWVSRIREANCESEGPIQFESGYVFRNFIFRSRRAKTTFYFYYFRECKHNEFVLFFELLCSL